MSKIHVVFSMSKVYVILSMIKINVVFFSLWVKFMFSLWVKFMLFSFVYSFVEEFTKPSNNGLGLLIKLLKSIQNTGSQQSGSTNLAQLKHYKKTLVNIHFNILKFQQAFNLWLNKIILKWRDFFFRLTHFFI
jgi:hypothetical protein